MAVTQSQVVQWLERLAKVYSENKPFLTDLDSAIGDADHGINMDRGFRFVGEKVSSMPDAYIEKLLKTAGMTLMSKVGGASGPLYGGFFTDAAKAVVGKETLENEDLVSMIEAGLASVVRRGRTELGDKTMVDAWTPALAALKSAVEKGQDTAMALEAAVDAAEQGVEDTKPMQARKGRASYLCERSIGHQDPGATSTWLMLKTLCEVVEGS
jgi:dihydroxyacetone kinase-like protein